MALGVDGGSQRAGLAVLQFGDAPQLLYAACVRMDVVPWSNRLASERLHLLFTSTAAAVERWKPDLVCVEKIRVRGGGVHRNLDSYLVGAQAQQAAILGALHGADRAGLTSLRVVEALAVQVRSRLRIRARKSEEAKAEVRAKFNLLYRTELQRLGFAAPTSTALSGPVPETMTDVTDAIALAWAAPSFAREAACLTK